MRGLQRRSGDIACTAESRRRCTPVPFYSGACGEKLDGKVRSGLRPGTSRFKRVSMIECRAALRVSAADKDHELLGEVFSQQGWTLYRAAAIDAAVSFLRDSFVPVLITERDLPRGNWEDLLTATLQLPRVPLLIVASRLATKVSGRRF